MSSSNPLGAVPDMSAPSFGDFTQQSALIESLAEDFQSGQFVHAYLFVGPAGVGKTALASLCVQAALCQSDPKPCGECPNCRRVAHENHPDVFWVSSEGSIGVGQIRELITKTQLRAFGGSTKLVILQGADRMTVQAQNCLLKSLEEPAGDTVWFLLCQSASAMLPTIRSRCRMIPIKPLTQALLAQKLRQLSLPEAQIPVLATLAGGSVSRALAIAGDGDYWQLRETILNACFEAKDVQRRLGPILASKTDKAQAGAILDILEEAFIASLVQPKTGEPVISGLYPPAWHRFNQSMGDAAKLELCTMTLEAKRMLSSNVSPQAVIETLFWRLSEEQKTCQW